MTITTSCALAIIFVGGPILAVTAICIGVHVLTVRNQDREL